MLRTSKNLLRFYLLALCACAKMTDVDIKNATVIGGSIHPLENLISQRDSKIISSAYASACADDVYARLHRVKEDGTLDPEIIESVRVDENARYLFSGLKIKLSETVSYQVVVSGCDQEYSRPVTNLNQEQDVTNFSTVVGETTKVSSINKPLNTLNRKEIEDFLESGSGSTLDEAFNLIKTNDQIRGQFLLLFQSEPDALLDSIPTISLRQIPSQINEGMVNQLKLQGYHWKRDFRFAYEWYLDGELQSTNHTWNFSPSANAQGNYSVRFIVGQVNDQGRVDTSKPYLDGVQRVEILNTIPANAPDFSLTSGAVASGTRSLDLTLTTGAGKAFCESFSDLALTEEMASVPTNGDWFNLTCDTAFVQKVLFTLTSPADGDKTLRLWARDGAGNISLTSKVLTLKLDTTAPALSLDSFPSQLKGGTQKGIDFSVNDASPSVTSLYFSPDGINFTLLASNLSNSYLWSAPLIDTNVAKFKLVTTDEVGNYQELLSPSFTIDSTAPASLSLSLTSSTPTASRQATLKISSCDDRQDIYLSEQNLSPNGNEATWITCSTSPSSFAISSSGDGTKTIYAWTRDSVGNISSPTSVTSFIDTTAPEITLSGIAQGQIYKGGTVRTLSWEVSDVNLSANQVTLEYTINGEAYFLIGSDLANSTNNFQWTLPLLDTNQFKIRITASDRAGNTKSFISDSFSIDSSAPAITLFTLANGATSIALPTVDFFLQATDSLSDVAQVRFSEDETFSNTGWQNYSTLGSINLSAINGQKKVYVWVKDVVGNISESVFYNILLDFGSPPTISILSPTTSDGDISSSLRISWSCSSSNGIDPYPIRLKYTTDDGNSFVEISPWISNNLSDTTGDYDWNPPGGLTTFRLLVECKSNAGVVASAYSIPLNTNGWSVFSGDPSYMNEEVNVGQAILINSSLSRQFLEVDSKGNIFFTRDSVIMKVDGKTALVTRFAGDPNSGGSCTISEGQDPLHPSFNKLGSFQTLFGMNKAKDSIIFGACNKIWMMNTSTRELVLLNSIFAKPFGGWFYNKTGILFYIGSLGKIFKLDLNTPNQNATHIMGNGTCAPNVTATGTDPTLSPLPGINGGGCGEIYFFLNSDDSKFWIGCWNGVTGCQNTARLDWNNIENKYLIGSENVGWGFNSDGDRGNCVPSWKTNRVWCSNRHMATNRTYYDTVTNTWTKTNIYPNSVFIRYASSSTGMLSLSSDNILRSHEENSDGTVTTTNIGGSNIETYGNGSHYNKMAYSTIDDISYSQGLNRLFVISSSSLRQINLTTNIGSTVANGGYIRVRLNREGTKFSHIASCGGETYQQKMFNGTSVSSAATLMTRLTCGVNNPDVAYPVPDGTLVTAKVDWKLNLSRRPLHHSNGLFYFFTTDSAGNNGILYSSNGTSLKIVSGISGSSGYRSTDHGQLASGARLSDVRLIDEIPTGHPYAGDLLIVDSNRLRIITIKSEPLAPKIYDVVSFNLASGYGSNNSNTFNDAAYDFNSEIIDEAGEPVIGTGAFYYVTSTSQVRKFKVTNITGATPSTAIDSAYTFSGTTVSGGVRIAIIPGSLLITQPTKKRVLRVNL